MRGILPLAREKPTATTTTSSIRRRTKGTRDYIAYRVDRRDDRKEAKVVASLVAIGEEDRRDDRWTGKMLSGLSVPLEFVGKVTSTSARREARHVKRGAAAARHGFLCSMKGADWMRVKERLESLNGRFVGVEDEDEKRMW